MNSRIAWSTVIVSALLMAGCGTADVTSQGTSPSGAGDPRSVSQGISLTQTVPSAEVSPASATAAAARVGNALSAASGAPPAFPRAIPRPRGPRPVLLPSLFEPIPLTSIDTGGIAGSTAGIAPRAPALLDDFVGLVDDDTVIPPDTMGAAGPNHLVSFLNSEVGFFSKTTRVRLNPGVSLLDFWSPLITANALPNNVFDPKVIYDSGSGRFIAVTLDGSLPADNSSILLAVSRTSDPTSGWNTWALPADGTGATWADFPGLGVDNNNIYITANLFDAGDIFHNSKIFRVPKPQLLIVPQVTTLSWTEFTNIGFNLQPAHSFGAATTEYFVTEGGTAISIGDNPFLHELRVFAIAGSTSVLSFLGTVEVTPYPAVLTAEFPSLPNAPQTQIDTGDSRILNVVQRNGHVYATHTVSNATNTKTEVAWYEIVPSSPPALAQQGRVSDPTRFYYYPSIAVNANGDIALGFSGSSTTEFAGGFYTARNIADPAGFTQIVSTLKAGEGTYFKDLGAGANRWGDYSATVVDPSDDLTFWTLQEYAETPINTWGTWWGKFRLSDVLSPTGLTATADNATQVTLRWTDPATNETGFVVERKVGAGGTFEVLTSPSLPPNSITYTDNVGLVAGTTYFFRVGAVGSTGTSYSTEASVTIPGSPPPAGGGGGGGGGGCRSIPRSGGGEAFGSSLFSAVILLLPACALGIRRFFRRRQRAVPIRHPLC